MSVRQSVILLFSSSVLLMIFGCAGSAGQGVTESTFVSESPLLNLLAKIPDNSDIRDHQIVFFDRLAIAEAYPITTMPESWEAFVSLGEDVPPPDSDAFPQFVWWRIFENSRLSNFTAVRAIGEEINETVGIDFFDISRELYFFGSSSESIILEGEFELENVREAFTQLDFAIADNDYAELWCGPAGCEAGGESRRAQRQMGNPFGGESGRKQPIILNTNYLMSSTSFDTIEQIIDVQRGAERSLASVSEYIAGAESISQFGPLLQATFIDGELLDSISDVSALFSYFFSQSRAPGDLSSIIEPALENYRDLPEYDLLVFADTATTDDHLTLAALVYDRTNDAERAADIVLERMETFGSQRYRQLWTEVLEEQRVSEITTTVYPTSTGHAVLIVHFPTPRGIPEDIVAATNVSRRGNSADIALPGAIYEVLISTVYGEDLIWASTATRDSFEDYLND